MARRGVALLTDPEGEGELVRLVDAQGEDLVVVRRCADLAEMRAAAAAGVAELAVVDGADPDLDRETVRDLVSHRMGVVLVAPPGQEERLTHLGASAVVPAGRPEDVVRALVTLARSVPDHPQAPPPPPPPDHPQPPLGRIVTVWGTSGAPGRSSAAAEIACGATRRGATLLVDADTQAPTLAHLLGLPTDVSVLAALCRLASRGGLDALELDRVAQPTPHGVGVLTGITAPQRWREITPAGITDVLDTCREVARTTVVDVHAGSLDPVQAQPTRGGRDEVLAAVLRASDVVLLLVRGDAVGLARCARSLQWWADLGVDIPLVPVVNRVAAAATGPRPTTALTQAMGVLVPGQTLHVVPEDPTLQEAQLRGVPLVAHKPRSPAARSWLNLADQVLGEGQEARRGVRH